MNQQAPSWWGLLPPATCTLAWGARAIFSPPAGIDLLPDRQSVRGEGRERDALLRWVNRVGLKKLRQALNRDVLGIDSNRTIGLVDSEGGYRIEASPRVSFGYLYLLAYPVA